MLLRPTDVRGLFSDCFSFLGSKGACSGSTAFCRSQLAEGDSRLVADVLSFRSFNSLSYCLLNDLPAQLIRVSRPFWLACSRRHTNNMPRALSETTTFGRQTRPLPMLAGIPQFTERTVSAESASHYPHTTSEGCGTQKG
jgi:hypothetical protein